MRRNGSFRDSKTRRSTPEALGERRKAYAERRARIERETVKRLRGRLTDDMATLHRRLGPSVTWPDNVAPPSVRIINHILRGENDGKRGGHLYGTGVPGKTEFPKAWSEEDIVRAVSQVMTDPDWTVPAKDAHALHWFGKVVNGVQIEVKAFKTDGKYVIDRAMPIGGGGVIRNTQQGKIDVKLSNAKRWRNSNHDH